MAQHDPSEVFATSDKYLSVLNEHQLTSQPVKDYYTKYFKRARNVYNAGLLKDTGNRGWTPEGSLKHGLNSVVGEMCEMMMYLHYLNTGHQAKRMDEPYEQAKGKDFLIKLPRWSSWVSVSVKYRDHYDEAGIRLRETDFPSPAGIVMRIMYVDYIKMKYLELDYGTAKQYFDNRANKKDDNVIIPLDQLLKTKHAKIFDIKL